MERPDRISLRNLVASIGLSALGLTVIFFVTYEPGAFGSVRRILNPWWLVAALGAVGLRIACGATRLMYVSRGLLGFSAAARGQLTWDFFSNVTPSLIGGGPIAAYTVAKNERIGVGESTAIFLYSMLLDQIFFALTVPVILVSALFLPVFPKSIGVVGEWTFILYSIGVLSWAVFFGWTTIFRPDLLERFASFLFGIKALRRFRDRVAREMIALRRRAFVLRKQPLTFFLKAFGLTCLGWFARYLLVILIILSIEPLLDVFLAFIRSAAMTLGSLVMPTPGGSGGIEGLYALLLGPLMPKGALVPTLITWRILGYYIYIALGAYVTMHGVSRAVGRRRDANARANGQPDPVEVAATADVEEREYPAD